MNLNRASLVFLFAAIFFVGCTAKDDEVPIRMVDPWVSATLPGQNSSAGYIEFHSSKPMKLIKVTSAQAASVQIHTMSHDNGVMRMGELPVLDIPANETIKLEQGKMHFMLNDLKAPLVAGDDATLSFTFELADKSTLQLNALAEVRAQ
jgi:periplasmic copper chaperone A